MHDEHDDDPPDGSLLGHDTNKRGGAPVPRSSDDSWTVSISLSSPDPIPGHGTCGFSLTMMRPDPLILPRVLRGQNVHKSDWWEFEFEGSDFAAVRRQAAIMNLTLKFCVEDDADDARELRRWICFHYAARTSPFLTRCASEDQPARPPARSLRGMSLDEAARLLARNLKRPPAFVLDTLTRYSRFLEAIEDLPAEDLTRERVNLALGMAPSARLKPDNT